MKKLLKTLSVLTVLALIAASCSKKDDHTGDSNV